MSRRSDAPWRGLALPLVLIVSWELAARAVGGSDSFAPPSATALALGRALADGSMLASTGQTFAAAAFGLALGAGAGLFAGTALGLTPALARATQAPIELLRPVPSVALIPLALIAFGFGLAMETSIVAFATFWPALILAQSAVAGVDRRLLEVSRALQLSEASRVFKIVLPAAVPRLVVALRLSIGIALVVAVTVEIAANPQGLGYGLTVAQQSLRPDLMLAYVIWIGLLGFGLNVVLVRAERLLLARRGVQVSERS